MVDFGQDHLACAHAGEIVIRGPSLRRCLAHGRQDSGGKGLEHGGAIGEKLHPHLVDHIGAAPEGQIATPVIGVPPQADETPCFEIIDDVRGGGDRHDIEARLGEIAPFPLRGLQDRA